MRMQSLPGAPQIMTDYGATPLVLYRKDRVQIAEGAAEIAGFRLQAESRTRRIVTTCCNTPVFLDFEPGHWLSLYSSLWPSQTRPAVQMRTMTEDLEDRDQLSTDIPNPRKHSGSFFFRLLRAWASMGFRAPKVAVSRDFEFAPVKP